MEILTITDAGHLKDTSQGIALHRRNKLHGLNFSVYPDHDELMSPGHGRRRCL